MRYINGNTFTTDRCRRVTVRTINGGTFLTVASTISDEYIDVAFEEDDVAALITMLNGEKLTPPAPKFKVGDLVRHDGTDTLAAAGSLVRVVAAPHIPSWTGREVMAIEWIDSRAENQENGEYYVESFSLVDEADLTDEDYQAIGRKALDSNR